MATSVHGIYKVKLAHGVDLVNTDGDANNLFNLGNVSLLRIFH